MQATASKRTGVAATALAVAATVALFLTLTNSAIGESPSSTAGVKRPIPESTTSATPAADVGIRLTAPDAELRRGLAEFSATVAPVATNADEVAKVNPATSLDEAARVAGAEVGFSESGESTEALLARVTLGQYGEELQPDPELPSRIDPIVKDTEAWVIMFPSAEIPVLGPMGTTSPVTVRQSLVVFVDSTTSEFLGAVSY